MVYVFKFAFYTIVSMLTLSFNMRLSEDTIKEFWSGPKKSYSSFKFTNFIFC
jgi:hypothetical protein